MEQLSYKRTKKPVFTLISFQIKKERRRVLVRRTYPKPNFDKIAKVRVEILREGCSEPARSASLNRREFGQ
jgi:hypothetical protein